MARYASLNEMRCIPLFLVFHLRPERLDQDIFLFIGFNIIYFGSAAVRF